MKGPNRRVLQRVSGWCKLTKCLVPTPELAAMSRTGPTVIGLERIAPAAQSIRVVPRDKLVPYTGRVFCCEAKGTELFASEVMIHSSRFMISTRLEQ